MGGGGGVLNTVTPQINLTNTASPQEKSTKHRHRKSATRIFSVMIRSSVHLKIIFLYLNNFPQNKHILTTLFIAHTSILLMPVFNHLVFLKPCAKEADKGKEKRPSPQIPFFFYLAHFSWCNPLTGADWSPTGLIVLLSRASK